MPLTVQALPFTMEFCLECHRDPTPRLRPLDQRPGLAPDAARALLVDDVIPRLVRLRKRALTIEVQMSGLGRDLADYIARCMRQIVGVETVLTSETRLPG